MHKLEVVFCCSGGLGKVALQAALKIRHIKIKLVLTDKKSEEIVKIAEESLIPVFIGNPRVKKIPFALDCDLIASVNYLFVFPGALLSSAKILAFNIHGSLLPKYMGRTPVTWAIINDEVETGITVHEMVADVDAGPIIYQQKILIANDETGGSLLKKLTRRYPVVLGKVFGLIKEGRLRRIPQDLQKRTYFGKRDPVDGLIDWRWSSRKVYNWVRAQTRPYPGAFGFIKGVKYRIWKVEEWLHPITQRKPGEVIPRQKMLVVSCGQGAVKLLDYSIENVS